MSEKFVRDNIVSDAIALAEAGELFTLSFSKTVNDYVVTLTLEKRMEEK